MAPANSASSKVALVTGANKGIGRAISGQLADLGICVYLGARDAGRGRAAERQLHTAGRDVRYVQLDVTDQATISAAAKQIDQHHGRLDILVNNAGDGGTGLPPSQTSIEQLRRTFEVNVFGVVAVTNAFLPLLRKSAAGRIVNVSTALASLASGAANTDQTGVFPSGAFPVLLDYISSKAALNSITITYANELRGSGILVNAASPGFVATDMNGRQGVLTTEQGARIPVLLATLGDDGPTGTFVGEDGTPDGRRLSW